MPIFLQILARERFSGANTSDIDGRTPDGGGDASLAVGEWLKHPVANGGGTLGIGNDVLATRKVGLAYGAYADYPLTAIPALPAVHRAEVKVVWPRLDADDPGGPLYCAFYGSPLRPGDPNPSTTPRSAGHSTVTVFMEWVGGSGSATVDATLSDGTHAVVEIEITAGGVVTQYISFIQFWGDPVTHREEGAPGVTYTAPKKCIQIGVDCNTSLVDKFGPCASTVTSRPTSVTISSYTYSVSGGLELDNVQGTAPLGEDAAFENAWVDATLRHDLAAETCYQATAEFDHSDVTPTVEYTLWHVSAGTFREMRSIAPAAWDHDVEHTHSLEIDANNVLRVYRGNDELTDLTFDLNTDVADEDGLSVPILTTGDPAVDVSDFSGTGSWMELLEFTVYLAHPCEGDDDNPYPWDPPPVPDEPGGIHGMDNLGWRESLVPPDATSGVRGYDRLTADDVQAAWVMDNLLWRPVIGPEVENPPPPNTDLPPYYDPCELLPPLDLPPDVPLDPPPVRFFGMQDTPTTVLGQLFNGTRRALGSHTPGELAQCAARGGILHCGIGGYSKFFTNGAYDPDKMDDYIDSHLPYAGTLQSYQTAGTYLGVDIMDDFASAKRWPPVGISNTEITRIVARWKTNYPWMRIMIRGRPSQFASHISGIDAYTTQFKYWGSPSNPTAFRDQELGIALSRGVDVLWALNYEDGGLGSSGYRHAIGWEMTAAEVLGCLVFAQTQTRNMGIGGFKFTYTYLSRPGITNALAILRNELAALSPP